MNCLRTQASLSEYVDNRLPLRRQHVVERHLEVCAVCRAHAEELHLLKSLLAQAPKPIAPEGFWDFIHVGLRQQAWQSRCIQSPAWSRWLWTRAPMLTGTAALLLLLSVAPLQYLEMLELPRVAPAQLLSRHAGVCARWPLVDQNRMQFIEAEARAQALR